MAFLGFGRKKEQEQTQPQYLEAGNIAYNDIVKNLFVSYLVNTYSHYLSNGGEKLQNNYTTMAKYQKCTFAEYCEFIQQGCDLTSAGGFNQERGQLISAQNLLTNNETLDQDYLKGVCSYVSRVYECALATSHRSQQILEARGQDPSVAEINFAQLNSIKANYENGTLNFTSQGFTRGSEVSREGGYEMVTNARQEIADISAENPNFIPFSLEIAAQATDQAQYIVTIMNSDFQTIQPQFPAEQ